MIRSRRHLSLLSETVRHLSSVELSRAAGGRPTSYPQCLDSALRPNSDGCSEAAGGGPCPGEYTFTCPTG